MLLGLLGMHGLGAGVDMCTMEIPSGVAVSAKHVASQDSGVDVRELVVTNTVNHEADCLAELCVAILIAASSAAAVWSRRSRFQDRLAGILRAGGLPDVASWVFHPSRSLSGFAFVSWASPIARAHIHFQTTKGSTMFMLDFKRFVTVA